jgi:hypothetical protein
MGYLSSKILTFNRKFLFLAIFPIGTLITVSSCEKNNTFGLEINPASNTLEAFYSDTFDLNTFSVYGDSIKTDELNGPSLLGNYIDPVFGQVNASIYSQIRLEQAYNFIPQGGTIDDIVIDSAVLYLAIDGYYGDIKEQNFNIEILDEDFYKDSSYYNNQSLLTKGPNISTAGSIKANPLFPGYFSGFLVNEAILGITLDVNEFALPIVNESGNNTLTGNDGDNEFLSFFKGIKISAPSNVNGGLYYINLTNSFSRIRLFYRDTSGIASDHDTLDFDFNINSNCAYYHTVDHDYSGTSVEEVINQPHLGRNQFYIQALGGVNGRVTIPELDSLIGKNIMANKAEIILPFENYIYDEYSAPSSLFISRKNNDGNYEFLPDLFEGSQGGNYDAINKNYRFDITRHVNEILAEKIINDTIKIFPNGNGITANRVVLNGINSTKKDKAKIVISYSKY